MHSPEDHDNDDSPSDGAEGAAVFPLIPVDLQVNPLLMALLHAMVFIDGSTDDVIDPEAADEAMQYLVTYLQRLKDPALGRVQEDMECLLDYAKQQGWPKQQQKFLKSFLADYGIAEK
jgi:hypothetical protein